MAEASAETWTRMVSFYRELIDEFGWRQEPMLEFVTLLANGPYSRVLHPSTSHAALGLAAVSTYQERLRQPMVYLVYTEPGGFVIHWQRGQGDEVRKEPVQSPQVPEAFNRILCWLGVVEQKHPEPAAPPDRSGD